MNGDAVTQKKEEKREITELLVIECRQLQNQVTTLQSDLEIEKRITAYLSELTRAEEE